MICHVLPEPHHICFQLLDTPVQARQKPRIFRRPTAKRCGGYSGIPAVLLDGGKKVIKISHADESAKWHEIEQVPNARLPEDFLPGLCGDMAVNFRTALLRHMKDHGTKAADIAKGSGVSLDIIKKLRTREHSSTNAESATRIAAYYGKTLAQFLSGVEPSEVGKLESMLELLTPEERRVLLAQIRGMIHDRER